MVCLGEIFPVENEIKIKNEKIALWKIYRIRVIPTNKPDQLPWPNETSKIRYINKIIFVILIKKFFPLVCITNNKYAKSISSGNNI